MGHDNLIAARKKKGFTQKQLASKIAMEQTTYSRKEQGKSPITDEEWRRIADILETPIEQIKVPRSNPSKNINCTFNDHSVGIQYITLPQEVLETMIKYSTKLEEENAQLKERLK